jgi:hypothetical protein
MSGGSVTAGKAIAMVAWVFGGLRSAGVLILSAPDESAGYSKTFVSREGIVAWRKKQTNDMSGIQPPVGLLLCRAAQSSTSSCPAVVETEGA